MMLCVENVVRDAGALEHLGEQLGFFDGDRADQYRLTLCVGALDLVDDGEELALFGAEDRVGIVLTDDVLIGGDLNDVQLVDRLEFLFLGLGGTGHAG